MITRRLSFKVQVTCFCFFFLFSTFGSASLGDRLPEFRECISVCRTNARQSGGLQMQTCVGENCQSGSSILRKLHITSSRFEHLINFSQRSICVSSFGHAPPIAIMSASISSPTVVSLETLQCSNRSSSTMGNGPSFAFWACKNLAPSSSLSSIS